MHTMRNILKNVEESLVFSELGRFFNTEKIGIIIILTLMELGNHQSPTPLHTDNFTLAVIFKKTVKCKI